MTNLDKFNTVLDEFNNKQEQLKTMFEDTLKEVVKEFLDKHQDILAIKWIAYIPYFNDGDPCEFRISAFNYISNIEISEENYDYYYDLELGDKYYSGFEISSLTEWNNETRTYEVIKDLEDKYNDCKKLEKFIYSNEDLIKYLFGNHHKVLITRESIEVEEYIDHD